MYQTEGGSADVAYNHFMVLQRGFGRYHQSSTCKMSLSWRFHGNTISIFLLTYHIGPVCIAVFLPRLTLWLLHCVKLLQKADESISHATDPLVSLKSEAPVEIVRQLNQRTQLFTNLSPLSYLRGSVSLTARFLGCSSLNFSQLNICRITNYFW